MRFLVPLLLAAAICLGTSLAGNNYNDQNSAQQEAKPFGKGKAYIYHYNAQISSGLIAQSDEDAADAQQKASTRIQAEAKLTFGSDRHAQLQLQNIRVGQRNERIAEPGKVQPMAIFEPKQIASKQLSQLRQPCQFSYADGVIDRVQFADSDEPWSKNIKRAVLNMIQLNLNRNNAQNLQSGDAPAAQQREEQEDGQNLQNGQLPKQGKTFQIPEITLEGACQTSYTTNQAQPNAFNVTKTIDFKQCSKIADVAYGFQTEQPQPQCAGCQQYWYRMVQQNGGAQQQSAQQQQQQQTGGEQQHPCAQCDPKEVKEQTLDRSTVLRYQLTCQSANCQSDKKYALKRTELLSQYVYKTMKAQSGKYSSAMHTVVAATLQFHSAQQQQSGDAANVPGISSSNAETMMYSNQWDVDAKRFFMFGDEEYPEGNRDNNAPFHQVPKVQQAGQAMQKIVEQFTSEKQKGIEPEGNFQVQRLVEQLRMCSESELNRIEQNMAEMSGEGQKTAAKHIFADALALCGTRNCVQKLAEKVQNKSIPKAKAIQALKSLIGLPAPSDSILAIVKQMCTQQSVKEQQDVAEACWLTFGALVNELCQHKTQKGRQFGTFGTQSGFDRQEQCPQNKKEEYKEAMLKLYRTADSIQAKVTALSALGNAGIDTSFGEIEQVIKDRSESRVVRYKAIDALRRLRTQMPEKNQQILLPLYQNTREHPEMRCYAFGGILRTLPAQPVIDQLAYTIKNEKNRQVQAYAYRAMKTLAVSKSAAERQISAHIKNALRAANVDEQELRNSGKWQLPVYSQQMEEGLFINVAQVVSAQSAAPAYLHAQINSFINDRLTMSDFKVYMVQQGAEQWYQQAAAQIAKSTGGSSNNNRARRSSASYGQTSYGQTLRDIYSQLGIKNRRLSSSSYYGADESQEENSGRQQQQQQQQQPFAMLCLRTGDVDHGCLTISGENMPQQIRQMLEGQKKPSFGTLVEQYLQEKSAQFRGAATTNLFEQEATIPTSAGLPLRIVQSMPMLAFAEGRGKISAETARLESPLGAQAEVNAQIMASLGHIKKMECRLPFAVSGVETIHAIEANVPVNAELNVSPSQGAMLKVKLPRSSQTTSTTLFGMHSLPFTYTAEVDTKTQMVHQPRHVRTVRNPKLEQMQHNVNEMCQNAQKLGIPLHIQGHYHWPAQPTNYQEYVQMLAATENAIHVAYKPGQQQQQQIPRELVFRLSGSVFQKTSGEQMQPLHGFYKDQFEGALDSDEIEEMELESTNQRSQKLQNFLGQYQPSKQYKHSMKMSAQTIGGARDCKAQLEVQTTCDAAAQACKVQLEAERTAIGEEETGQKWTLSAEAQMVMPQRAQTVEELEEQKNNNRFQCQAKAVWGSQAGRKQQISMRIQAEQAKRRQQQGERQNAQQQQREYNRKQQQQRSAFLNKIDVEVRYENLKPEMQNTFGRALELAKSTYFWNTQSKLTETEEDQQQQQQGGQSSGRILATVVIDPSTQKHANATVKTPGQIVRFQQVELPVKCRPFPLIGGQQQQQQQKGTHSIGELIGNIQVNGRAECAVDGKEVDTFDDVEYSAPLSTDCYSVLAKDCSLDQEEEGPQFAVLMKALQEGKNGQKKLKVFTPSKQIVCQPKAGSKRIVCKENGRPVENDNDDDDSRSSGKTVQFNNAEQSDVTVHVPGISVRFNGRKAWLKVSSVYKNSQCGLCGHYDESADDGNEWRMSNNQNTNDLAQFHRSYVLKGNNQGGAADEEDGTCSADQLDTFYQKHGSSIRRSQNSYSEQEDDDENNEQEGSSSSEEEEWENELFNGEQDEDDDSNGDWSEQQQQSRRNIAEPIKKIRVLELNHQLCFSQQPIRECPKGTVPKYNNGDDDESQQATVRFACLERFSTEARRLLRAVQHGNDKMVQEELKELGISFSKKVHEPKKCVRTRF